MIGMVETVTMPTEVGYKVYKAKFIGYICDSLGCQNSYGVGEGYCDPLNFVPECDFDRNDCVCPFPHFIGDTICDPQNNLRICNYDGLDCGRGCPLNLALYLGNGSCNLNANTSSCLFDGGDCL